MESLDIRFNYFLRTTHKNSDGKHPIVLRIIYRAERRDVFTGIYSKKSTWQKNSQRVSEAENKSLPINRHLEIIKRKAHDCFDELRFSMEPFSIDDLIIKIKGKEEKPQLLIEFLEETSARVSKRVGVEISKQTYYKYKRTLVYVQDFLPKSYKAKNFLLCKINVAFLESYFQYLRIERKISHNTSLKYLSFLKVLLAPVIRSGLIKDDPFKQLRLKAKPVYRQFLTEEEIKKIEQVKILREDLDRKRDIFLFACYTGLAYTDIKQLSKKHIIKDKDGSYYILKPRQKTGQESIIPLLPAAEKILQKYSLTGNLLDFKWQISSNQKMNLGLKEIGKKAEIEKTLHMHLGRHTFATTVTLSNGVPIESVSKMLGHASIKQTQHYAKVVAAKIKLDMQRIREIYK